VRDNGISWVPFFPVSNPTDHKIRGLDGIAWLGDSAPGDLAAIRWIRDNVHGPQGVAEAAFTYEYNMQGMHGRVSAYTGQPTIVAWHGHEVQWRGGQPDVLASLGPRESDQDELYATTDVKRAREILQKYGIHYVFVGTIEKGEQGRASGDQGAWKYSPQALAKFGQFMQPVFNSGGATVYMLPDVAAASPGGANPGALPHP
jgi:uncharacterized membrane protein